MPNPRKDYKLYLLDISSACKKITSYTKNLDQSQFARSQITIDAVIRNLEIIGEAVNKIPGKIRNENDEIPWKDIVGLRNKVIHEYFEVNVPIIWKTVKEDIPVLERQIKKVLINRGF
mgnify:CR=1 FL=1